MNLPPLPINYEERMTRFDEEQELQIIGQDVFGREVRLTHDAAKAWESISHASEQAGVRLLLLSGFRSIQRQAEIVKRKLDAGILFEEILQVSAYPGFSEHHTGRAIDIGSPHCEHFTESFEQTAEFTWLCEHASEFGFLLSYPRGNRHGISYEPWHWCLAKGTI